MALELTYTLPYNSTTESVPERGSRRSTPGAPDDAPVNWNLVKSLALSHRAIPLGDPSSKEYQQELGGALALIIDAFRKMNTSTGDIKRLVDSFTRRQESQRQTVMDTLRNKRRRISNPGNMVITVHSGDRWIWDLDTTGAVWTYRPA